MTSAERGKPGSPLYCQHFFFCSEEVEERNENWSVCSNAASKILKIISTWTAWSRWTQQLPHSLCWRSFFGLTCIIRGTLRIGALSDGHWASYSCCWRLSRTRKSFFATFLVCPPRIFAETSPWVFQMKFDYCWPCFFPKGFSSILSAFRSFYASWGFCPFSRTLLLPADGRSIISAAGFAKAASRGSARLNLICRRVSSPPKYWRDCLWLRLIFIGFCF